MKYREFWINDNAEGDGDFTVSRSPWFGHIHVIDYAAYDSLKTENINLYGDLNRMSDSIKTLILEKDAALKILEEMAQFLTSIEKGKLSTFDCGCQSHAGLALESYRKFKEGLK